MIIGYAEPLKLAKLVNGTTTTEPVLIPFDIQNHQDIIRYLL